MNEKSERLLRSVKKNMDMMIVEISDTLESCAPKPGKYAVSDGDTSMLIDTMSKKARTLFTSAYESKHERVRKLCHELNVEHIGLSNEHDVILALKGHFSNNHLKGHIR